MKEIILRWPRNWIIAMVATMAFVWAVIALQGLVHMARMTASAGGEPVITASAVLTAEHTSPAYDPAPPAEELVPEATVGAYEPMVALDAEIEHEPLPSDFPVPPSDNLAIVWNFFRGHGFSPEATAAIIGNLQIESHDNINPSAVGDEGASRGIAQWNRDRLVNLQNHAHQHGRDWLSIDAQLEFMLHELMTGQNVQWWRTTAETGKAGVECFIYAVCVVAATVALSQAFHRPGIPHMGESGGTVRGRIPRAEAALERFYVEFIGGNGYAADWSY
ncbi:MAG: phage tail tip lysozyme [Defluviitaleaceae bacterium]|nr:phage tail tip lysozyme [Defluviitaleaceae bacterium]